MVKDVNVVKKKLESRVSVAGSDYEAGMKNPSQDPIDAVLQKLDKLYRGLQEAIASGAIEAGLKKAKAEGKWQEAIDKAVRRWLDARTEMAEEYAKAYEQILKPALETVTKEIEKMPDITLEQRIQKAVKFMQRMSEEIRKRKGLK
jgi:benzoyl-CoA reductase/2-hydroxyglutaryl-CoA dehydratase subunit BcrC/BadD/HgdB